MSAAPVFGWAVLDTGQTVLGTIEGDQVFDARARITPLEGKFAWQVYHLAGEVAMSDEARDFGAAMLAAGEAYAKLAKLEYQVAYRRASRGGAA